MRNAQTLAMQGRQRQFVVVMVAAIVERNAQCNLVFLFVKQRNAVHSATHYNYRIFHLLIISLNLIGGFSHQTKLFKTAHTCLHTAE